MSECEPVEGGGGDAAFQRVGFSGSASVSQRGRSITEEGAGWQALRSPGPFPVGPSPSGPSLLCLCSRSSWDGGSGPLKTGQLEGRLDALNPTRLLAHRIAC